MKSKYVLLCLLFVVGCAPLTEDELAEREYNRAVEKELYEMCRAQYRLQGKHMYHVGHVHERGVVRGEAEHTAIKSDLYYNDCYKVVGGY